MTSLGENHWMYFYGPDRELVEVFTASRNHRFEERPTGSGAARAAARN